MDHTTTSTPPAPPEAHRAPDLASASLALGVLGLLPVLPFVGSLAAIVCGFLARDGDAATRRRGNAGIALGCLGVVAPLVALFVYCVVLGYPFPIHRYRPR